MARLVTGILVAGALVVAPAWAHAEQPRKQRAAPALRVANAPHDLHHSQGFGPARAAPLARMVYMSERHRVFGMRPAYFMPRFPAEQQVAFIRPAVVTCAPRPVYIAPPVVTVPAPYYVEVDSGYAETTLARTAESDWTWTPVTSIAALAGRGRLRQYCPDTRTYYPQVETCPSPWLKAVP